MNAPQQHSARPSAPLELLRQLHGWLNNTGFGDDHPWCVEILRTVDAHAETVTVDEAMAQLPVASAMLESIAYLCEQVIDDGPDPKLHAMAQAMVACVEKAERALREVEREIEAMRPGALPAGPESGERATVAPPPPLGASDQMAP